MKIHPSFSIGLAFVLGFAVAGSVKAQTSDTFQVSITVANDCTITVADLPFGTVTSLAANIDQTTTGSVTCTSVGPVSVSFDEGSGGTSTFAVRQMEFGAETINYNLYRDAGFSEILGDGTGSTFTIDFTSTGAADALTIHGRVDGGQGPKPTGTYASVVTATVAF